jgi:hypothetical protein
VELLERVVGQDRGAHPVGDLQQEAVAPAERAGGRRDDLARGLGLLERLPLGLVDAVAERGVDDDDDLVVGVLGEPSAHGFVELGQAGRRASLGGEVRAVDDDGAALHVRISQAFGEVAGREWWPVR